jgi:hypothetical protein
MHAAPKLAAALSVVCLLAAAPPAARAAPRDLEDPVLGSGSLALSARAAWGTSWAGRRGWVGVVSLVVPLDRLATPPQQAPALEPSPEESGPEREVELKLTPAIARRAVQAALRAARLPESGRRLDALQSRAKSSAFLPELRLRGARTTDESLRLAPTTSDPYRYTQAGGASLTFEARLTWKLDRLVFASEEIQIERLRGQRGAAARTLVREVLKALVAWQRAELRAGDPASSPEERLDARLDALEAEATLDVLTDGWFSWRMARSQSKGE